MLRSAASIGKVEDGHGLVDLCWVEYCQSGVDDRVAEEDAVKDGESDADAGRERVDGSLANE